MEPTKDNYTFTIIIPTFNRKKYLIDTLGFIQKQHIQPLEIIVVDASEPAFRLNESDRQLLSPLLNYIAWNEYGNISKQRNHAINLAKGEYILFLDDDVIFDPELMGNYVQAFSATGADGISGLVETEKYKFGSNPIRNKGVLSDMGEDNLQPCNIIATTRVICTASFAIKTNILRAIGGFDEYQRGIYDDVEAGFRLHAKGYVVLHHPLPKVFHIQAKISGARDLSHGNTWIAENKVYFFLKHRYNTRKLLFLFIMLLEILRPSRAWLHPYKLFLKSKIHIGAFRRFNRLQKNGFTL